jgi:hypothetical protein
MIRLAAYEWKKIARRQTISGPIIALLIFGLLLYVIKAYVPEMGSGFSPESYRTAAEELVSMDTQEAYAGVEAAYEEILYEGKIPEKMYGKTVVEELSLYTVLMGELEQAYGYPSYIDGVLESAARSRSGIFSGNTEAKRAGEKTYNDFSNLQGIELYFAGSYGIVYAMQTDLWDILFFLILILFVYGLVITEYEECKINLMRTTAKGRGACFGAKLLAGLFFVVLLQSAVYVFRFAFSFGVYGCPELSVPFQTVYGAQKCPWNISILTAIALFFAWKLAASAFLYCLNLFFALLCQEAKMFYGGCLCAGVISSLCYTQIDANSFWAKIKWLNPAAFLAADSILMDYRNISVLGYPLGYPGMIATLCVFLSVFSVLGAYRIYIHRMQGEAGILSKRKQRNRNLRFHFRTGIWRLESKKYWIYQAGALICIFYVVIALLAYEPVREHLYTKEEIYYKYYVTQVQGTYTDEKMETLSSEQQRLDDISTLLETESNATVASYYMTELEKRVGLESAISYATYVKENGDSIIYEKGYELLIGKDKGRLALLLCRLASLAVVCLLSVSVWNYDMSTGMEKLIQVSKTGNKRLVRHKYANVLLGCFVVFLLTFLPWIYNVYSVFGLHEIHAQARSMEMFSHVPAPISVLLLYGIYYLGHFLYLCLTGCLGKCYTKRVGNYMGAVMLLFVTSMIPVVMLYILVK